MDKSTECSQLMKYQYRSDHIFPENAHLLYIHYHLYPEECTMLLTSYDHVQ